MRTLNISTLLCATLSILSVSAQDSDDDSNTLSTSATKPRAPCKGPFKHHINMHVYDLTSNVHNATSGLSNKNAFDTEGALTFIFGDNGTTKPALEKHYQDGLVEMVHVSLSSWGDFLHCDKKGCHCPKNKKSCDKKRPGNHTLNGTTAFSFPHAGEGHFWDYDKGSGCSSVEVRTSCIVDHLAKQAGCPGICGPKNTTHCVDCVNKLSNKEKKHVWDAAIFNETCPDSRRRRSKSPDHRRRRSKTEVIV